MPAQLDTLYKRLITANESGIWEDVLKLAAEAVSSVDEESLYGTSPGISGEDLIQVRQQYINIRWYRGIIYWQVYEDYTRAAEDFRFCCEYMEDPGPYVYTNYAQNLYMLDRREEALAVLDEALDKLSGSNKLPVYWNKGWFHFELGEYEAAVNCGAASIQYNPRVAGPIYNAALALLQLGEFEKVLSWFGLAFSVSFHSEIQSNEGINPAAIEDLNRYFDNNHTIPAVHVMLSLLYLSQGEEDKAKEHAQAAGETDCSYFLYFLPDFLTADLSEEAGFYLAKTSLLLEDYETAGLLYSMMLSVQTDTDSLEKLINRISFELNALQGEKGIALKEEYMEAVPHIREGFESLRKGEVYKEDEDWESVFTTYNEGIDIFYQAGKIGLMWERCASLRLGILYIEQGMYDRALPHLQKAAEISRQLPPMAGNNAFAEDLTTMAGLLQLQDKRTAAGGYMSRAASVFERIPPFAQHYQAVALREGKVDIPELPEIVKGKPLRRRAINLEDLRELENVQNEVLAELKRDDLEQNEESVYKKVLQNIDYVLHSIYVGLYRYGEAEFHLRRVIHLDKELEGVDPETNPIKYELITIYFLTGRYEECKELLLEKQKTDIGLTVDDQIILSHLYYRDNDFAQVEEYITEALIDAREIEPYGNSQKYFKTLGELARLYIDTNNFKRAENILERLLQLQDMEDPEEEIGYYRCISDFGYLYYKMGTIEKAKEYLLQAAEKQEGYAPQKQHSDYLLTIKRLARIYMDTGLMDKARKSILLYLKAGRDSIDINFPSMSEYEKERFLDGYQEGTALLLEFLSSQNTQDPLIRGITLNHLLFTKGILFKTSRNLRYLIQQSTDPELANLYDKWVVTRDNIEYIQLNFSSRDREVEKELIALEEEASLLEKELIRFSNAYRQYKERESYSWQDIQDALGPREAAVEIFYQNMKDRDSYYLIFIIRQEMNEPEMVIIPNEKLIDTEILSKYRDTLGVGWGGIVEPEDENKIYAFLWEKVDSKLKDIDRIYLIPDGVYSLVNLNTLRSPNQDYLIDRYDIRLLSSSSDIIKKRTEDENKVVGSSVLIAYPSYNLNKEELINAATAATQNREELASRGFFGRGSKKVEPLPGTRDETLAIKKLLEETGFDVALYLSEEAVEERVKSVDSPGVLHIATHGFFSEETDSARNPLFSTGLLFAGAADTLSGKPPPPEIEDGVLTAYEALQLSLNETELVVLSACETGVGHLKSGEGAYNLQRAFSIAGARYVIMSLWQVDDLAAQEFMILFYKNWLEIGNIRNAFRNTVMKMKDLEYPPRDWGAFVLNGL